MEIKQKHIEGAWLELLNQVVDAAAQMDCYDDFELPYDNGMTIEYEDIEPYNESRKRLNDALDELCKFERGVLGYYRHEGFIKP